MFFFLMVYLLKMVIFNSHVKLPEGTWSFHDLTLPSKSCQPKFGGNVNHNKASQVTLGPSGRITDIFLHIYILYIYITYIYIYIPGTSCFHIFCLGRNFCLCRLFCPRSFFPPEGVLAQGCFISYVVI